MYVTISIPTGLYPNLDLWNANKLRLQLPHTFNQCHIESHDSDCKPLSRTFRTSRTIYQLFMSVILCIFLHSVYQPTNALNKIQIIKYTVIHSDYQLLHASAQDSRLPEECTSYFIVFY